MNVLAMGGRVIGEEVAHELVRAFLKAKFPRNERHFPRLAKVQAIERRYLQNQRTGTKSIRRSSR
ncbi:MAG TPA: RpiB/LacA/LacB family sugar-phosphate isomerase [Nitrospiraceae bacterium]|nr:RpiB/LacA/LacB family sugar-phosphate isomerase [Nitrospiraceae bacterium]